jgi:hypothetical protein
MRSIGRIEAPRWLSDESPKAAEQKNEQNQKARFVLNRGPGRRRVIKDPCGRRCGVSNGAGIGSSDFLSA